MWYAESVPLGCSVVEIVLQLSLPSLSRPFPLTIQELPVVQLGAWTSEEEIPNRACFFLEDLIYFLLNGIVAEHVI